MDVDKWRKEFAEASKHYDTKLANHLNENAEDKLQCDNCHVGIFFVYCTEIIDDAGIYCVGCGKRII